MNTYFYLNIGEGKEILADTVRYILSPDIYEIEKAHLGISELFITNPNKISSYVVVEEFGNLYAFTSTFSSSNISKKIERIYEKNGVR